MPNEMSYIINLKTFGADVYEHEYHLDKAWLTREGAVKLTGGDCIAKVVLQRTKDDFALTIQLKGFVCCPCDRCLDDVEMPVDCEETVRVKLAHETQTEDITVFVDPAEGNLNLGELFYELIVTNLPIVIRHQEGKCNPQMEELLQTYLCSLSEEQNNNLAAFPEA